MPDMIKVLQQALAAKTKTETEEVLRILESIPGSRYVPVGGIASNLSTIHNAGDPNSSLVERITNAIDAELDHTAERDPSLRTHKSPRTFVETAYKVHEGSLASTKKKDAQNITDEAGIVVCIWDGDAPTTPTIDIRDHGIGVKPPEFATSILALHQSNKITRWYLMGRFGQGGSQALRHSKYCLIVSKRHNGDANPLTSFTVVRLTPARPGEKNPSYEYIVDGNNEPFSCQVDSKVFKPGTLVRHVDYALSFRKKSGPLTLDIYSVLQRHLFDPVLPFSLDDQRKGERRRILGARAQLTRSNLTEKDDTILTTLPSGDTLAVRYWVFKSGTDKGKKGTYVDMNNPIHVTYNGQAHAFLPSRLLHKECGFRYLYQDLVVQVDCDILEETTRQEMFTSSREHLTEAGREILENAVSAALRDDEDLQDLESRREQEFISGKVSESKKKMSNKLAEMINRIRPGTFATGKVGKGVGPNSKTSAGGGGGGPMRQALPTQAFPTFLKIANKADPIKVPLNATTRIELNTDAPDNFLEDTGARLALTDAAGRHVDIISRKSDFHGGRLMVSVQAQTGLEDGHGFDLGFDLIANDPETGTEMAFTDHRAAVVVDPVKKDKGKPQTLLAPDIIPVGPDADEEGRRFWENRQWTNDEVAEAVIKPDSVRIFVSIANKYLVGTLAKLKLTAARQSGWRDKYVLHAAFHAYLQEKAFETLTDGMDLSADQEHSLKQQEMERAARTILTAMTHEESLEPEDE